MTHPPYSPRSIGDPRPLTAEEINRFTLVEIIMRAPLDQAVAIAVGRASTCWTDLDGSFGMAGVFDDQTASQIVDALLARISAELAGSVAEARGEDRARAMIPTLAAPTEIHDRRQCGEMLRLEGHVQHSQCLLLEGHDGEHQNGNLHWRSDSHGPVTAWWDTAAYEVAGLGELLRSGVMLTLPHLPALEPEPDVTARITYKSTAEIEGFPPPKSDDPQE